MTEKSVPAAQFLGELNGGIADIDQDNQTVTMSFDIEERFCHTVNIVQGGFQTSMLDAAMTHAAFIFGGNVINVATMEIKVSFLEVANAGKFTCAGTIVKLGRSTGFMSGELFNAEGKLVATASTTAKLVRQQ